MSASDGEFGDTPSRQPAYLRLHDQIRDGILGGQLPAGSRLPSSRVLAAEAGVSRNTVLAAFEQLQAQGYLVGRRGVGTFVATVLPDGVVRAHHRRTETRAAAGKPRPGLLSRRGQLIADNARVPLPAVLGVKNPGPAFQIGLPAVHAFPLRTWNRMRAAHARRLGPGMLSYDDPAGYRPLRQAIATYIATARGVSCSADQVVIVTGSQQALDFCSRVLLDAGDPVWLEDPGYLGARAALASAGARIVPVPVDDNGIVVDAGIAREPRARMAVVTPSHQFPTGATMSLQRRGALIEWAGENAAWIVEDDYDNEFRYHGRPLAALQSVDPFGRVIYVGTFSKVLYPSLRLGYLVLPPDLVDAFVAAHLAADMHAHIIEQSLVAEFIESGHLARHVRRMRMLYSARQQFLFDSARDVLGDRLRFTAADGGLHLVGWARNAAFDDRAVARRALERGVHVWPLSQHYLGAEVHHGLLLGFAGADQTEMTAALTRLRRALG